MNETLIVTKRELKQILDDLKEISDNTQFSIYIDKPYDIFWHIATEDDE